MFDYKESETKYSRNYRMTSKPSKIKDVEPFVNHKEWAKATKNYESRLAKYLDKDNRPIDVINNNISRLKEQLQKKLSNDSKATYTEEVLSEAENEDTLKEKIERFIDAVMFWNGEKSKFYIPSIAGEKLNQDDYIKPGAITSGAESKKAVKMLKAFQSVDNDGKNVLDFRLGVISTLINEGKGTLYDILKASHSVGVKGEEDLSDGLNMYLNVSPLTVEDDLKIGPKPHELIYTAILKEDEESLGAQDLVGIYYIDKNATNKPEYRYYDDREAARIYSSTFYQLMKGVALAKRIRLEQGGKEEEAEKAAKDYLRNFLLDSASVVMYFYDLISNTESQEYARAKQLSQDSLRPLVTFFMSQFNQISEDADKNNMCEEEKIKYIKEGLEKKAQDDTIIEKLYNRIIVDLAMLENYLSKNQSLKPKNYHVYRGTQSRKISQSGDMLCINEITSTTRDKNSAFHYIIGKGIRDSGENMTEDGKFNIIKNDVGLVFLDLILKKSGSSIRKVSINPPIDVGDEIVLRQDNSKFKVIDEKDVYLGLIVDGADFIMYKTMKSSVKETESALKDYVAKNTEENEYFSNIIAKYFILPCKITKAEEILTDEEEREYAKQPGENNYESKSEEELKRCYIYSQDESSDRNDQNYSSQYPLSVIRKESNDKINLRSNSPSLIGVSRSNSPGPIGVSRSNSPGPIGISRSNSPGPIGVSRSNSPGPIGVSRSNSPGSIGVSRSNSPGPIGVSRSNSPGPIGVSRSNSPGPIRSRSGSPLLIASCFDDE